KLHTAISDLEVVSAEESGHLWHIRYPLADGSGHVVVATTRPETMLGDTAVAVNPADDRYRRIIGKQIQLPLTERLIPVIADDYVDPEFGSGCVKITPAHDFNDYEVGQRHDLERINIFTIDAVVNENAPPKYQGMDRYAARKQIVADLDDLGLLARVDDHRMMVPRGDRSGVVVEPMLTDQWFVRIQPLADPAIAAVEDGRVRFIPENYAKTYFEWMRNIQDWCISRQLWWGHRIPAWYDEAGNVYVGDDEADARQRNGLADDVPLEQDQDVLDTWFSSALWPFSTLGWPEQTPELKTFYPTSVLVTGFDIIFFWVARMIMMGLKFMGDVPFREVYIHGLVRDGDGNKMSKSKGNVLDPMDLIDGVELGELIEKRTTGLMRPEDAPKIEKTTRRHFPDGIPSYGTDALRFTFAALATLSPDIKFDLGRIEGYRNFCNKIWNAARFILMVTGSESRTDELAVVELGLPERWIKARLDTTVETVRDHFENYRFDLAAQAIYEFIWDEFCDWYLEAAKITLNDEGATPSRKLGTSQTLLTTFETSLRLAHPLIPYITEELWQQIAPLLDIDGDFIMTQRYPLPKSGATDSDAVTEFAFVQDVVRGVRRIRAEYDLDPRKSVPVLASGGSATEQEWLARNLHDILSLARLQRIESVVEGQEPRSATALAGSMKLLVPLADLIDPEAERARLDRELGKLRAELEQAQKKLANESFVSRAPAEVV
ncbi:MAG: valine--tRNA ligase, partial [Gammaproteobacteria bacterium]|nr:valine--tRNA ligase [Gammaproteobacteria bacterium]